MRFIILAFWSLVIATAAFADSDHSNNCNGNNSCPTTINDNDTTTNAGGSATAVAAPVTVNTNTAIGGAGGKGGEGGYASAKIEKGAIDVDTRILNSNYNLTHVYSKNENEQAQQQRQHQGQYQGQSQGIESSGNSSIVWNEKQQPVASAQAAAAIIAGCGDKTFGLAGQGLGFGGSVSLPFGSNCEKLAKVATLVALGKPEVAFRTLCRLDDDVAEDVACVNALAVDPVKPE